MASNKKIPELKIELDLAKQYCTETEEEINRLKNIQNNMDQFIKKTKASIQLLSKKEKKKSIEIVSIGIVCQIPITPLQATRKLSDFFQFEEMKIPAEFPQAAKDGLIIQLSQLEFLLEEIKNISSILKEQYSIYENTYCKIKFELERKLFGSKVIELGNKIRDNKNWVSENIQKESKKLQNIIYKEKLDELSHAADTKDLTQDKKFAIIAKELGKSYEAVKRGVNYKPKGQK